LGSFTFEDENDSDSGYVCECSPDYRGDIWLYGALTQGQRGYLSRTNNGFTGYQLHLRYDHRFNQQLPPCFFSSWDTTRITTDTLNFGEVPVGSVVWDTAQVYTSEVSWLGSVLASQPYDGLRIPPYHATHFTIPVSFSPPHPWQYNGMLTVVTSYHTFQIHLCGHGVAGGAPEIAGPSAYPNPFNATTTFTFSVEQAGPVVLELYDISGRLTATVFNGQIEAGIHNVNFNARDLPSGVYFARLRVADQIRTTKSLLIK
jgi:hypothetical protein